MIACPVKTNNKCRRNWKRRRGEGCSGIADLLNASVDITDGLHP